MGYIMILLYCINKILILTKYIEIIGRLIYVWSQFSELKCFILPISYQKTNYLFKNDKKVTNFK